MKENLLAHLFSAESQQTFSIIFHLTKLIHVISLLPQNPQNIYHVCWSHSPKKKEDLKKREGVAAGSSLLSSSPSPSPSSSSSFVGERGVLNYLNRWSSLSLVDLNVVVCELNSVVRTITSVQLCAFGEIVAVCVDKIPFPFRFLFFIFHFLYFFF